MALPSAFAEGEASDRYSASSLSADGSDISRIMVPCRLGAQIRSGVRHVCILWLQVGRLRNLAATSASGWLLELTSCVGLSREICACANQAVLPKKTGPVCHWCWTKLLRAHSVQYCIRYCIRKDCHHIPNQACGD
jgi:hypothetical protein